VCVTIQQPRHPVSDALARSALALLFAASWLLLLGTTVARRFMPLALIGWRISASIDSSASASSTRPASVKRILTALAEADRAVSLHDYPNAD
jgi:hypothetical protein